MRTMKKETIHSTRISGYKKLLKIIFLSIFSILHFSNILILQAQPLFEVERASFCREIQNHEPIKPFSIIAEIKKTEGIFFWMEIKAGNRALSMLETKSELPIYHAWASDQGISDFINVGIKNDTWLKEKGKIRNELKIRGFFTWRTQSFKRNFKEGRYYVSILDANKKPVRKSESGVEAFRPEIVIRFIP